MDAGTQQSLIGFSLMANAWLAIMWGVNKKVLKEKLRAADKASYMAAETAETTAKMALEAMTWERDAANDTAYAMMTKYKTEKATWEQDRVHDKILAPILAPVALPAETEEDYWGEPNSGTEFHGQQPTQVQAAWMLMNAGVTANALWSDLSAETRDRLRYVGKLYGYVNTLAYFNMLKNVMEQKPA